MKSAALTRTKTVRSVTALRRAISAARSKGKTIGFVPTMGALHRGHQSLIKRSVRRTGFTVVSIFVNPTQFGPSEDFASYPRPLKSDIELVTDAGADLVFVPSVKDIYPDGFSARVIVDELTTTLCGASRPTHFQGVTTVVAKLFNMVQPDFAFFGQKDAQQGLVIRRMVRDLNMPLKVVLCPTVRESDGLAMSSRNAYLTPAQRSQAPVLHRALQHACKDIRKSNRSAARLIALITKIITSASEARIDYVEIVDTERLKPIRRVEGGCLIALAVYFGKARLIDNAIVRVGKT